MDYLDFVLRLDLGGHGGLAVRLVKGPAGTAEAPFVPPPVAPEVERTAEDFERLAAEEEDGSPSRDVHARLAMAAVERQTRIGTQLFAALFPEPVRDRYYQALGQIGPDAGHGLRLELQMGLDDPRLVAAHGLPWECLHRAEDGTFLGRERRTSIVRHLDLPLPGARPPLPGPLRVLVVAARPRGLRPLPHLERERSALLDLASRRRNLEVASLGTSTLEALRDALLSGGFHVLHFLGHGGFDAATGEGVLYLEDGARGAAPVSGSLLADHLRDITSLRLVVLNACQTARAAAPGPFGGVATALLRAGLPAVVAMQFPISDRAANAFSAAFYKRLAAGDPIDAAVAEGRLRIHRDLPDSAEWATPALFLRAADGRLFEPGRRRRRQPWAVAGIAVAVAAGLLVRNWDVTKVQQQPVAAPPAEIQSATPEPTAPPEGRARPATTPPSEPAKPRESRALATYTLSDRSPVLLPEINSHLTANFNILYGELVVTLILAPKGAPGVRRPVMAPGSIQFETERGTYRVEVLAIDEAGRSMTVLPGGTG